ncbi:MAG: peptide deformylase [Puniceicoccales bacterium]|jgi:peptide deformylase|nr:peptide deformylase [Puniceicoccales bacterium]
MNYKINGKIYVIGEPILRTIGSPITDFSSKLSDLLNEMYKIMKTNEGIGIAAQQLGLAIRCCVIDISEYNNIQNDFCMHNDKRVAPTSIMPLYVCNPKIVKIKGECVAREGCLSIPDFGYDVKRFESIEVEFQNSKGEAQKIECNGILARCMQHEFDHLEGKLFIDRLSPKGQKKFKRFLKNKE